MNNKDMTIEEKSKRYDGLIERLKDLKFAYRFSPLSDTIEEKFPELKESGDEIRKELLKAFQESEDSLYMVLTPHRRKSFITWLEKQGEKIIPLEEIIFNVWELGNHWKELNKGVCNTEHGRQLDYIVKHWKEGEHYIKFFEKHGKQKKSYDTCDSSMMDNKKSPYGEKRDFGYFEEKPTDKVEPKFKVGDKIIEKDFDEYSCGTIIDIKDDKYIFDNGGFIYIGEQGLWQLLEQKSFDYEDANIQQEDFAPKLEPKFKVGDWIITNKNHIWYVDETPETTSYLYRLINQYGKVEVAEFEIVDKEARLWNIADAKDGDVLATLDYIFVFKNFLKNDGGISYCHYDFGAGNPQFVWLEDKNWYFGKEAIIHPATKEQRDLLFQKMHEAGYEWNPVLRKVLIGNGKK